jgi:signal transduction histidine kinase
LLENLVNVFDVNRALHLHYDIDKSIKIVNEKVKNGNESLIGKSLLDRNSFQQLTSKLIDQIIVVDDVETGISNQTFKDFLKGNQIKAFLLYSVENILPEKIEVPFGLTMICSSIPRMWTSEDIDSFKLIIETATLVYFEVKQRYETEQVKQTFLATLTHDLRSPINAEQKTLEAILSKRFGTSLENFSDFLQDIYKTNEELLRIVNNILSVYHYESGKYELKLESASIGDIINDSVNTMKLLAEDQESEIITNIQEDLPLVMVDKSEITRVINNLIGNAIKHNKKGTNINIESKRIDNEVQVSVSDNGKGIPEGERSKIFRRFPTEKRKIGTGLGLYLSKQIIDAHHGKIWFESEVGKGTTFYFTLPIS